MRVVAVFSFGGGAHDLRHGHGLGDDEVDVRVDEDVGDLVDGAGLVDGHGHEAGRPAREVEERPLVAGAAHDRDAVAELEAPRDEAGSERVDLVVKLSRRDGAPRVADADLAQDEGAGRAALHAFFEQVGDRRVLVDAHQDGGVPLEGLGGRLRRRRLVNGGRGRGFFGGHVCSLVAGRCVLRCLGTRSAALLLLPLSYAPVGWGRGSVFRGGCLFLAGLSNSCVLASTLERFEGLRECFFECQPGLACGKNREDDDAVVGREEGDEEGLAESDDAHTRVVQGERLAA